MLNAVKLIVLLNGDLILSEIFAPPPVNDHDYKYTLTNPVKVIVIPNKVDPRNPQIGFAPWAQFTEDIRFDVDMAHVITTMNPVPQMLEQYNSLFSKIIQPVPGLILPTGK